jgi:general secretion pathway protein D
MMEYLGSRRCHRRRPIATFIIIFAVLSGGCAIFSSPDAKRGDEHLAAGNWEEAILAYKQALKDEPFDQSLLSKYALARERAASAYEERGRALLKERQIDLAIDQFKRALTIEPTNPRHQASLAEALRLQEARSQYREAERLAQLGRTEEAMGGFARAAELDPAFKEPLEGISKLTEEQQAILRGDKLKQPVSLRFKNAGIREVLEGVAKAGGFTLIFDKDVRNDPISITVQDTPFEDALNLLLNSNGLFSRVVSPGVLIISPNTKQKQEQYQDLMIRTFYLSTAKAKDMLVLLKSMLDIKRMHANEQLNTIVVRDQPEKIEMAEKIILANDRQESEVLFDVEVLEVDRTTNQTYGLSYPKQIAAAIVPPNFTGTIAGDVAQQLNYRQLTSLGESSYLLKLPTNIQLDFFKQTTDAKTLAAPKVRVVNNKKAEINIGDKQPILLSTTNVLPGQAATGAVPTTSTVTSIEFRDTGVKLTVEPSIRLANELGLKMKIEVVSLGQQVTLQANPPITQFKFGNRSAETTLNVKDGETIVLGGLIQEQDQRIKTTIPWIGDLPLIGNLLSGFQTVKVTTEVILTITPHIVQSMTPPSLATQAFWSGTEMNYATNPLFSGSAKKTSLSSTGGLGNTSSAAPAGSARKESERIDERRALAQVAVPDPALLVRPVEASIAVGKEIKLAIVDGRLRASEDNVFRLEYDPKVLQFKRLVDADLVRQVDPVSGENARSDGTLAFRLTRPSQTAPRSVTVTFLAKAPGVSPVRVEVDGVSGESTGSASEVGTGVVRVR